MKKSLLLLSLLLLAMHLSAQTIDSQRVEGSFSELKGAYAFAFKTDWSAVKIMGMDVEDWIDYRQFEQPEFDAKHEWEYELMPRSKDMLLAANEKLATASLVLTPKEDAPYTLTVRPLRIDKKGNQTDEIVISDTKSGRLIVKFYVTGKGGVFGSMSNLWGDGFKSAGKRLGNLLKQRIK